MEMIRTEKAKLYKLIKYGKNQQVFLQNITRLGKNFKNFIDSSSEFNIEDKVILKEIYDKAVETNQNFDKLSAFYEIDNELTHMLNRALPVYA
jgi:hypothetical protein